MKEEESNLRERYIDDLNNMSKEEREECLKIALQIIENSKRFS